MSVDISKLHNVLRDNTRARIIELLNEKGSLSYVELQELLHISHTGKLNYHLKMLGDLILKDEHTGRYSLGEKGTLAVALLSKFQTVTSAEKGKRRVTKLTIVGLIATIVILVVALIVAIVPKPVTPTLQVSQISLSPSTISQNSSASLSFTIKNNDATKPHLASVFFENLWNLNVYLGNTSLTTGYGISNGDGSSKIQFYHIPQLQPSQSLTVNFRVTALTPATYSIPFFFTDENSTRFDNETVSLTVN